MRTLVFLTASVRFSVGVKLAATHSGEAPPLGAPVCPPQLLPSVKPEHAAGQKTLWRTVDILGPVESLGGGGALRSTREEQVHTAKEQVHKEREDSEEPSISLEQSGCCGWFARLFSNLWKCITSCGGKKTVQFSGEPDEVMRGSPSMIPAKRNVEREAAANEMFAKGNVCDVCIRLAIKENQRLRKDPNKQALVGRIYQQCREGTCRGDTGCKNAQLATTIVPADEGEKRG